MAVTNSVRATLKLRNDTAANWTSKNPVLSEGEFGLEKDTLLIKVGDGTTIWSNLRYLNKLDTDYFIFDPTTGEITLSANFANVVNNVITTDGGTVTGTLAIQKTPVNSTDAANKQYVDVAIAGAGHLVREIVTELPTVAGANDHTIYMIKDEDATGDQYKEYMLINGQIVQTGDTSVDLKNLVTGSTTTDHLVSIASDGSLVDSGLALSDLGKLNPATSTVLGGVLSSTDDNYIQVDNSGFMTLNRVSTSLLYVPVGDTFVIDGGGA